MYTDKIFSSSFRNEDIAFSQTFQCFWVKLCSLWNAGICHQWQSFSVFLKWIWTPWKAYVKRKVISAGSSVFLCVEINYLWSCQHLPQLSLHWWPVTGNAFSEVCLARIFSVGTHKSPKAKKTTTFNCEKFHQLTRNIWLQFPPERTGRTSQVSNCSKWFILSNFIPPNSKHRKQSLRNDRITLKKETRESVSLHSFHVASNWGFHSLKHRNELPPPTDWTFVCVAICEQEPTRVTDCAHFSCAGEVLVCTQNPFHIEDKWTDVRLRDWPGGPSNHFCCGSLCDKLDRWS